MRQVRVVEVLAALSLTTDLASGVAFEKGLRTCAVATALGRELGLPPDELKVVFHTSLLRAVGCTSHASENGEQFGDDIAFQSALKELDLGDRLMEQLAGFGSWAGPAAAPVLRQRFLDTAHIEGPRASAAACEVGRALGPLLELPAAVIEALDQVYERWDGRGIPGRASGDGLAPAARISHLAEQAVLAHARGGRSAAVAEVALRAGGHLDPDLAAAFAAGADAVLAPLAEPDVLAAVVAAEPGTLSFVGADGLDRMCHALSVVVDLKGRFLLGHSAHVSALARSGAALAGLNADEQTDVRRAGLLHDIGRAGVPSSVWDRPGPLTTAEWERVRLHSYWTGRVLARCPSLAPLAPLAASHHERLDGSGYHRGARAADLSLAARLLAAADELAELTEDRPYRPAFALPVAAKLLEERARAGQFDAAACAAVIEAAGLRGARPSRPGELTEREVDVLRLAARGLSNRQIAEVLVVSPRTVGNHLAHIYDKTGRRTRAGVAVYAMEHGLLNPTG